MSNAQIDSAMSRQFGADFIGALECEEHPELGGSIRVYQSSTQRILVEVDPDFKATVYTFHSNLEQP